MKRRVALYFCIIMLASDLRADDGVTQSIGQVCSFRFPGAPQITQANGARTYLYATDSCSYLVQVRPVTQVGVIKDSATLSAFYGGAVKGILRGFKASKISEKRISIKRLIGEELEYIVADPGRQPISVCSRILMIRGRMLVYTFSAPYDRFAALKKYREGFFASLTIGADTTSDTGLVLADSLASVADRGIIATPVFDSATAKLHTAPAHRELVKANTLRFAISFVACILLLLGILYVLVRLKKKNKTLN